jgi:phosphatidylglycerophosphatase GEP4
MNRQHLNTDALKSLFNAISHRNTLLRPRLQLPSLAALNPQTLHDEFKIRAIIFDVDNTLTRPYSNAPADSALATLRRCDSIFGANRVALLSNHAGSADDIGHVRAAALEQSLGARVLRRTSKAQKPNVALGRCVVAALCAGLIR